MDPVSIVIEVISALFPWKEIFGAWSKYLEYKAKIREIDAMEQMYLSKVSAFKDYVSAQKEIIIEKLKSEKQQYLIRASFLEKQLNNSHLNQEEFRKVLEEIRHRMRRASGAEALAYQQAYLQASQHLSSQSISAMRLLSNEIELQIRNIDLIDLKKAKKDLLLDRN